MLFRHLAPTFAAAASAVTFLHASALVSASPAQAEPLTIAKMGSMEAGGRVIDCQTVDGGDANNKRQTPGHLVVDQVYASYIYPQNQRHPYPILFNPGGGHTARFYDTTPDGREGWLTLFAREGFPTYGVDRVNTGRSGSDICKLNAVRLGQAPIARAAGDDPVETVREHVAGVVARAADLPDAALPAVHGWVAYLEDRALQWSALPAAERDAGRLDLVEHCTRALALLSA